MLFTGGTELLSINEAAEKLQCSRAQLYRLFKRGDLALIRHNGRYWLEPTELEDYFVRLSQEARKERAARHRETKRKNTPATPAKTRKTPAAQPASEQAPAPSGEEPGASATNAA